MAKLAPITARPHVFYVRPAPGWLDLVHDEVTAVLSTPLQKYKFEPKVTALKSTVKVHRCDWRQGLEMMLRLTTAHDVEWLILESNCTKWPDVDAILGRVPWDEVLPRRGIAVHVSSEISQGFTTSPRKLRENLCRIAQVEHVSEGAPLRLKIELRGGILRILASLSGEPLYKRGYKAKLSAVAPLAEHQAAACVRWVTEGTEAQASAGTVYVPFAGTGTLGFESLVVLSGAGPGAFSRRFACDDFPGTPAPTMGFIRRKLAERLSAPGLPAVVFNDHHPDAIATLKENTAAFPAKTTFEIFEGNAFDMRPAFAKEGRVLILLNPPYGDRLAKDAAVAALYGKLGALVRELSEAYEGRVSGGCLCPDEATWRRFGASLGNLPSQTRHFTHGGKDMRLTRWRA